MLEKRGKIRLPFSSTTSFLFLPGRALPHSELQVNTQYQAEDVIVVTDVSIGWDFGRICFAYSFQGVIREMMVWFNNEFSAVRNEKERELRSLADRRDRLRQVADEIKELGGECRVSPEDMAEPSWLATEKPETFLEVLDSEVR